MARFSRIPEGVATTEVARIYRQFTEKMGFPEVPTFLTTQGNAPSMLAGTCGLIEHLLLEGALPRVTKELIFLAVATERECEYCKEAHTACCRTLGVEEETIEAVRNGLQGNLPKRLREILVFAIKCSLAPEELTDEDFEHLHQQELTQQEILEIIATAAMAIYTSIIAYATLIEPDPMFAATKNSRSEIVPQI